MRVRKDDEATPPPRSREDVSPHARALTRTAALRKGLDLPEREEALRGGRGHTRRR